jgi:hypothetical protein
LLPQQNTTAPVAHRPPLSPEWPGLELGGLLGGTLSGVLSDASIKASKTSGAGQVGRRVQIVIGYLFVTLGVLALLRAVPASAPQLQWMVIAALGFGIYGPQMLIGLCGAEIVSKKSVGASQVRGENGQVRLGRGGPAPTALSSCGTGIRTATARAQVP